jgi:hypothetical protein
MSPQGVSVVPINGLSLLGYSGVAVVVLAWLVVSFTAPSRMRSIVEWVGACGLYLALVSLFTHLALRAQASGSTAALVGFGFLLALFSSGLVVSLVQTLLAFRTSSRLTTDSATH